MTTAAHLPTLSAQPLGHTTRFCVWAPEKKGMVLHIVHPFDRHYPMTKDENGYWTVSVEDAGPGTRYFLRPDDETDLPDPASRYQPEGVHGPSEVVAQSDYVWNDSAWENPALEDYIIYELHVGSFTPEGSFEAIIPRLDELISSGFTAIEIMPVAQFPGNRNWGYDGVFPFAVQHSYGGPLGLKKLVDACHQKGLAVILDVVYNHLGPEGNYARLFAPYFSGRYHTLWGDAINFDWEWSDGVRHFFASNVTYWLEYFHMDALRFDAIHAIFDFSPVHFWERVRQEVNLLQEKTAKTFHLIAESDLNDPRVLDSPQKRGYGFDAQWLDDFHHALYKLLFAEDRDRYNDFGTLPQLAKAFKDGFVHCGDGFVPSRKRWYGGSSAGLPGNRFVVFYSNHDQAGNRPDGGRPSSYLEWKKHQLAAAAILLSPYIPLLFMGDEYGEEQPFYYFISHQDPELIEAVRKGRKEEFRDAGFNSEPPDAHVETTFQDCVLQWDRRRKGSGKLMLQWHEALIKLRKEQDALRNFEKKDTDAQLTGSHVLTLVRRSRDGMETLTAFFNFSNGDVAVQLAGEAGAMKLMDSGDSRWHEDHKTNSQAPAALKGGQSFFLQPLSVVVYVSRRGKDIES